MAMHDLNDVGYVTQHELNVFDIDKLNISIHVFVRNERHIHS